jgi:hypothetical protein
MAGRGLVSRSGSAAPSSHGRSNTSFMSCNRCRKALSTTVFVCACDCVFCEGTECLMGNAMECHVVVLYDNVGFTIANTVHYYTISPLLLLLTSILSECTYEHFNQSSSCPTCSKKLGAEDFMELVIADPSASTTEAVKNNFQTIFTKCTKSNNAISHQEMCQRLLKNLDIDRRAVRFLMKQFVNDVNNQGQKSGSIGRAYEVLKQENTQLKQASSSQRLQMEQTIADLQHRVQALNGTVQGQQKKLSDKDKQLTRFRELYEADGMARIPSSSHSQSSGGKRGHSNMVNSSSRHQQQQHQQQEQQHAQPPMQGFVMQKQARERAKEQALGEFTRRGPVVARPMTNESSLLTPMQLPRRPLSTGSLGSASGQGHQQHQHHHQHHHQHPTVPSTPRIRDLSSSNGYVFTSSASGRRPGNGNSGSGHPMQQQQHGSKHPRRTTDSPSSGGFAFNQGNQARQQQQQQQQSQSQSQSHNYGAPRFNSRG